MIHKKFNKISILIPTQDVYNNFIETNAFSDLEKNFNVSYVLREDLIDSKSLKNKNFYKNDNPKNQEKHAFRKLLLMYRNINKSSTFLFRIKRFYYPLNFNITYIPNLKNLSLFRKLKKILFFLIKSLINNFRYFKLVFLSSNIIYKNFSEKFFRVNKVNKELFKTLDDLKTELLIFPYSGTNTESDQIIQYCKNKNCKSYFITNNWDNLSSKSVLEEKPNYVGVWGQQSKNHAIDIQNINPPDVFLIGSPRFDLIKKVQSTNGSKNNYVLFLGHLFDWKEEDALKILDDVIDKNNNILGNIKILYRPHPQRINRIRSTSNIFKHIEIDEELKHEKTFWPNNENLYEKIHNSIFVVGTLTSALLESVMAYKKYLLLTYDEKNDFFSQHKLNLQYTHVKEIHKISTVTFCKNKLDLEKDFLNLFKDYEINDFQKIDGEIKYFLENSIKDKTFSKLLFKSVENLN